MRIRFLSVFVAIVAVLTLTVAAQTGPAQQLLEAAKKRDVVDGDVKGAIQQYQLVVDRYAKTDRAAAAQALLRMAECYQKLGDAEAQRTYERIVKDFADQTDAVKLARIRLGGATDTGGTRTEPVWTGRGVTNGVITGDKPLLAYTDRETGNLAIRELAGGRTRLLTHDANWQTRWAESSVASHDGRYIAYEWYDNAKDCSSLRVIGSNGDGSATPKVLYDNPDVCSPAALDWSADGSQLAVRFRRNDKTTQVGVVRVADGSVRMLKTLNWTGRNTILMSPDAKYLAYDLPKAEMTAEQHIAVLSIDGAPREVVVTPSSGDYRLVGWTADSSRILFTSGLTGTRSLWGVGVRSGRPEGAPRVLKADFNGTPLGLTRSGTLYYSVLSGGPDIAVASFDSQQGRLTSGPSRPFQPAAGARNVGDWSSDGRYLSYFSLTGDDDSGNLLIKDMVTGRVRAVTHPLSYTVWLFTRWSADGRSILTRGENNKGRLGFFRIDATTGETSALHLGRDCKFPSPTSDSTGLFCGNADDTAISRFDSVSGSSRELVKGRSLQILGGSPDGKYLAFAEKDPATKGTSLKLLALASGDVSVLLTVDAPAGISFTTFAWTPDSQSVVFRRSGEMWFAPLDGRPAHKIDMPVAPGMGWRFNPKTDQVAFGVGSGREYEIWKLENFLPPASPKR